MIVFDLKCAHDHVFEAWFGSSTAFEDQRTRGLVSCPLCGDTAIIKAVMAPNIMAKGNSSAAALARSRSAAIEPAVAAPATSNMPASGKPPVVTNETMKAALQALAVVQSKALEKSEWVGRSFADRARAMHAGEEVSAPIHGQSTRAEARALVEEGVPIAPLLLPVVPPEALN